MQKINPILFYSASISLLLGLILLLANGLNIYQYQWKPLQLTLAKQAGTKNTGQFVAELTQRHEVELEFSSTLTETQLMNLLTQKQGIPSFSVDWKVFTQDKLIAQGNSQSLLYHSSGGRSFLGQVKRFIFSNPFHTGQGSAVRGIGQFTAKKDQTYQVQITVNAVNQQLNSTNPRLNIRPSRLFWQRHSKNRLLYAYTGFGLFILGSLLFAIKILLSLIQRKGNSTLS